MKLPRLAAILLQHRSAAAHNLHRCPIQGEAPSLSSAHAPPRPAARSAWVPRPWVPLALHRGGHGASTGHGQRPGSPACALGNVGT